MMRVLALVVVYGCRPVDTLSLHSLLECERSDCDMRVLVWDNSPHAQELGLDVLDTEVGYIFTPENLGLSIIFNRVIREHLRAGEYLLLLDQDTGLPPNFLTTTAAAVVKYPAVDLFLPMVRANGRWASPVTYACGWGRAWPEPKRGKMPSRRICAINSGMVISAAYLHGAFPGYDERLRFYGTDTQFMLDYIDRRPELHVLDATLSHDLSFFSGPPSERVGKFLSMRAAYRFIYVRRPALQKVAVALVMALVSVRYAIRYRDVDFLRVGKP